MSDSTLPIYLNDHLGMITGELELACRVAQENEGTSLGGFLADYIDDVDQQKDLIEQTLDAVGGKKSVLKQAAGWLAEKAGRFKLNDSLLEYTDLARVLELEALTSAAQARRLLWETLSGWSSHLPQAVAAENFPQAQEKTSQQIAGLHQHHQQAVQVAFKELTS